MKYKKIGIDATLVCHLNCPLCSTGIDKNEPGLGKSYLRAENFKKILELNSDTKIIELSNSGKNFLNKELGEIFKLGYEYGITVKAKTGVNLINSVRNGIL